MRGAIEQGGRQFLSRCVLALAACVFAASSFAQSPIKISSARVWPAAEYTRITFESRQPISFNQFTVPNPDRIVLDLENVELSPLLNQLGAKIGADDPYIKSVRVGRYKPGVVRLVFDLKQEVKPSAFLLKPVGNYEHRLVLDVYPAKPIDPLLALLETGSPDQAAAGMSPPDKKTEQPAREAEEKIAKPEEKPRKAPKRGKNEPELIRLVTIAIDAGHGGEDPGAKGKRGTHEADVTLSIARRVKAQLEQEPNMRAVLTRDGDYFLTLRQRIKRAREAGAMMFVSVHADSVRDPQVSGSSVYVLSEKGATDEQARWLADRENAADLMGGVSLDDKDPVLASVLVDLTQSAQIGYSMQAAERVLTSLREVHEVHRPRVQQAGFVVLKSPDIPSMLVETAFISNASDERKLTDPARQSDIATAIFKGVHRYFVEHPPEGSRFALERAEARRVANAEERRKAGAL